MEFFPSRAHRRNTDDTITVKGYPIMIWVRRAIPTNPDCPLDLTCHALQNILSDNTSLNFAYTFIPCTYLSSFIHSASSSSSSSFFTHLRDRNLPNIFMERKQKNLIKNMHKKVGQKYKISHY